MNEDRVERELRLLFQRMRSEEERRAPAFEPVVRAAARSCTLSTHGRGILEPAR